MKKRIKRILGKEKTVDLDKYISGLLDGDDYNRGALESARATADNVSELLGRLIDILTTKKVLSDDDLLKLLGRLDENDLKEMRDVILEREEGRK